MRRRSFLESIGVASVAASLPLTVSASSEPLETVETQHGSPFRMEFVEVVRGKRFVAKGLFGENLPDYVEFFLSGNVESPKPNEVLSSGGVKAPELCRTAELWGLKVSGVIGGRPWRAFAKFSANVSLHWGDCLTVSYDVNVGDLNIMSPFNLHTPLKSLI